MVPLQMRKWACARFKVDRWLGRFDNCPSAKGGTSALNSFSRAFLADYQLGRAGAFVIRVSQLLAKMQRRFAQLQLCLAASLGLIGLLLVAGCGGGGGGSSSSNAPPPSPFVTQKGKVEGGGVAIAGASVTLYAAGTAYGADAVNLGSATADGEGHFNVTYQRQGSPVVLYLVALGGDAGSGNNTAIGLMGIIGLSNSVPQSVTINELTTVAGEWTLAQFTDATGQVVGAPSTNTVGLANAAKQAQANLANIANGEPAAFWTTYNAGEASCTGGSPPVNCDGLERMDTFANILAACVESSGPSSSECDTLMANTGSGSTTLEAAHFMATNLTANIANLYALQSGSPPFTPALGTAPDGWEIALNLKPDGGHLDGPYGVAVDASGNPWVTNETGNTVTELSSSGGLAGSFDPVGANFDEPIAIAIDASGKAWVANFTGNTVTELSSSGGLAGSFDPVGANFDGPNGVAIDASGNAWFPNGNGNTATELTSAGDLAGNFDPSSSFHFPSGVAIDASGNAWMPNEGGNDVTELTSLGALAGNFNPAGANFSNPNGIAIDATGNVWVPNTTGDTVTELASNGDLVGNFAPAGANFDGANVIAIDSAGDAWVPNNNGASLTELTSGGNLAGYFTPAGAGFNHPNGAAIDAAGNVWISNKRNNSVSEMIGVAGPVLTPLVACLKVSPPHAVCLP
jgi:streptogramin lyase